MAIVFAGCMYLIFKPSEEKELENIGLNDAVPQATEAGMPDDKGKAYELDMLEQKDQEKRNALTTLSDYWNEDSSSANNEANITEENENNGFGGNGNSGRFGNSNLNSYRNSQNALGSFYSNDNSETEELRRQLDELKEQLADRDVPKPTTVDDQIALMEKSYQIAAKYLPQNTGSGSSTNAPANGNAPVATTASQTSQKEHFVSFTSARKTPCPLCTVSLPTVPLQRIGAKPKPWFYTVGSVEQVVQPKTVSKPAYTKHRPLLAKQVCVYD